MLSIQQVDCIKELLQMVVEPPVITSCLVCPITFSYFQLFITLSRYSQIVWDHVWCNSIFLCNQRRPLSHYQDKILKCTVLPRLKLSTILPVLLKSPIASKTLKPGTGIWPRLPQWGMPFLAPPQTLSQTWSGHEPGEKQWQFIQVQEAGLHLLTSSCTGTLHSSSLCTV